MSEKEPGVDAAAVTLKAEALNAVALKGVSKTFWGFMGRARVKAVDDLSLTIPRGQIFGLLGPNGSGKTTTMSMILGLLRPTSGCIEVLGQPPGSRAIRSSVGYLPEEFNPPELLKGEEVLAYYGGFYSLPKKELKRRIDYYLDLLDMQSVRRRRFREYSKGMQRRIGLAQVLLHDPELMLLDEPINGLDPIGVRRVKSMLIDLREKGRTILISSHMLPEIEEICDCIAILHRGSCVCSGPTDELLCSSDQYQIILQEADSQKAERAGEYLGQNGYSVGGIQAVRQSLESLFLEKVQSESGKNP